jgi:hypothetical protein
MQHLLCSDVVVILDPQLREVVHGFIIAIVHACSWPAVVSAAVPRACVSTPTSPTAATHATVATSPALATPATPATAAGSFVLFAFQTCERSQRAVCHI